jgi:hypothetical protein
VARASPRRRRRRPPLHLLLFPPRLRPLLLLKRCDLFLRELHERLVASGTSAFATFAARMTVGVASKRRQKGTTSVGGPW